MSHRGDYPEFAIAVSAGLNALSRKSARNPSSEISSVVGLKSCVPLESRVSFVIPSGTIREWCPCDNDSDAEISSSKNVSSEIV